MRSTLRPVLTHTAPVRHHAAWGHCTVKRISPLDRATRNATSNKMNALQSSSVTQYPQQRRPDALQTETQTVENHTSSENPWLNHVFEHTLKVWPERWIATQTNSEHMKMAPGISRDQGCGWMWTLNPSQVNVSISDHITHSTHILIIPEWRESHPETEGFQLRAAPADARQASRMVRSSHHHQGYVRTSRPSERQLSPDGEGHHSGRRWPRGVRTQGVGGRAAVPRADAGAWPGGGRRRPSGQSVRNPRPGRSWRSPDSSLKRDGFLFSGHSYSKEKREGKLWNCRDRPQAASCRWHHARTVPTHPGGLFIRHSQLDF